MYNFISSSLIIFLLTSVTICSSAKGINSLQYKPDSAQDHLAESRPQRQQLSPIEARKFDYFFYEGVKLKNTDNFDAAFEMFRHCLSIDSTSSAALYELSTFFININKPEKAVSLLKKSIAYAPDNQDYRNNFATLLFNLEMYEEAAKEYEILIKLHPEKPDLNVYLAESYSRTGETAKAIDIYNELENLLGMYEAISIQKYQLYMKLEQIDNALNEIKKLSDKFPMESRYPMILGDSYLQQNDNKQALKYYQKAYDIDPETPYYPVSMANYYEKIGQRDSAKQQIIAALVNQRLDIDMKLNILTQYIGQLHVLKQDIEGADGLFQTLLDQHPDESRLKLIYSMYLTSLEKYDEALFQIRLVTDSEPENIDAWEQLFQLSLRLNNFVEAINICKKCIDIFPEALGFRLWLGISYYQNKDYQSAIDAYLITIPLIPAENIRFKSDIYGNLGDTYFRLKDTEKAFNAYEEALKYNDKNIFVLNNYAYYLSLLKKDLAKAERMSAQTIKMQDTNPTYIDTYAWIFFMQGNFTLAKLYIEQSISRDKTNSKELIDHYGDILFFSGDKEKAVEQWKKAKELGKNTVTVNKKIADKTYYEAPEEELLNDTDEDT